MENVISDARRAFGRERRSGPLDVWPVAVALVVALVGGLVALVGLGLRLGRGRPKASTSRSAGGGKSSAGSTRRTRSGGAAGRRSTGTSSSGRATATRRRSTKKQEQTEG
jgi:hypothetical protein